MLELTMMTPAPITLEKEAHTVLDDDDITIVTSNVSNSRCDTDNQNHDRRRDTACPMELSHSVARAATAHRELRASVPLSVKIGSVGGYRSQAATSFN